jgi:hypothetical protein
MFRKPLCLLLLSGLALLSVAADDPGQGQAKRIGFWETSTRTYVMTDHGSVPSWAKKIPVKYTSSAGVSQRMTLYMIVMHPERRCWSGTFLAPTYFLSSVGLVGVLETGDDVLTFYPSGDRTGMVANNYDQVAVNRVVDLDLAELAQSKALTYTSPHVVTVDLHDALGTEKLASPLRVSRVSVNTMGFSIDVATAGGAPLTLAFDAYFRLVRAGTTTLP